MIERALGHVGQVAASALVAAVLIGTGVGGLSPQYAPGVAAGALVQPDGRRTMPTPTVSWKAPAPALTPSSPDAIALADDVAHGVRVAPHLDAVAPMTAEVGIQTAIVMSFSQRMNRQSVESSFLIQPGAEGRFVWSDDYALRFEPFRLAYATSYQVEVGGRSDVGAQLSGSRWWSFTTVARPPDALAPGPSSINVPILTYHYIRVNPDRNDRLGFSLSVTPSDFAAEMDWLAQNGYHTITTEDLYTYLNRYGGLPSKPVILTFDDGYEDFYTTALPILRSHGFVAVAYVVSGFVGWPGYMTAAQIHEADRSGMEIGSHTVNHPNLASLPAGAVRTQVVQSKEFLEQVVGHPVVSFCYPSGKYTSAVAAAVAAAGYHDATTTRYGYSYTLADRYVWSRLRVSGGEPLDQFAAAVRAAA
ncbi:MAG TPA: polysaccharide deacetylase family protein [Candidatus Dormibacteraeota bacterium]